MAHHKNFPSRFFEDYRLNQKIIHPLPRKVSDADQTLYTAFTGSRFALQFSPPLATRLGYSKPPLDDILVFHMVFGRTVPDLSLNALANLGYADCRFLEPVFAGDTLRAESTVVGLRENSNGKTGIVYVRSVGFNQNGARVLEFYRWLMMKKRSSSSTAPERTIPKMPEAVAPEDLTIPIESKGNASKPDFSNWDCEASGSPHLWEDYKIGEQIHHIDGQTIEEAEHQLATRLYQNNARVHFNQHVEAKGRFGKRIIYGGIIISLARAISANGLANCFKVAAINAGSHTAPTFAGDTIYAWSQILDKYPTVGNSKDGADANLGALRVRTIASKNNDSMAFSEKLTENVVLDLDYTLLIPKKAK